MADNAVTTQEHLSYPGYSAASRDPGQPILCLHCSTGSSRQWRSLAASLGDRHRVIAPDLLGYGNNPPWAPNWDLRLETEVRRLVQLMVSAPGPVDVVAHSFGAAVAVKLALLHPEKVRSLTVFEPVLFALLRRDADSRAALAEIFAASSQIDYSLADGNTDRAARTFIDFWSGNGTWSSMPQARRQGVSARIEKVRADFDALLADETTLSELARLDIPVLCLSGEQSPAVTRRITDLLCAALPRVRSKRFEEMGHMGPLTHPRLVNDSIEEFLKFLPVQPAAGATYTPVIDRAA
ncbi:MAG: alpha/beta fold hydrolase [Proteobacteria bacterium]|jgi:pimeloyl-ACP methyl ester carboxylesterase|nr:alpha/beta fold hydrolase [Pseudomonadota bacterium]